MRPQSSMLLLGFSVLSSACAPKGFRTMQDEQGGVVSDDGLRVAGIYQTWEGACDPDRAYSTYRWCSDFRREGYVKDHTFQLWVSTDEQSLQLMDATPSTPLAGVLGASHEGQVYDARYVHSDSHHYVLVAARVLDFVEEGATIHSGAHIVYQIPLLDNGQEAGPAIEIARQAVSACVTDNQFSVNTNQAGDIMSIVRNSGCESTATMDFYDADDQSLLYSEAATISSAALTAGLRGSWVTVAEGASDAELSAAYSNPHFVWNDVVNGEPSPGNPQFYDALLSYFDALDDVEQAAQQSDVFVATVAQATSQSYRQVRFRADATIAPTDLVPAWDQGTEVNTHKGKLYYPNHLVDHSTRQIWERFFMFDTDSKYVYDNTELGYDTYRFVDRDDETLEVAGLDLRTIAQLSSPSSGDTAEFFYSQTAVDHSARQIFASLSTAYRINHLYTDGSYDFSVINASDGFNTAEQAVEQLRFEWTFSDKNELYTCLLRGSQQTTLAQASIDNDDLLTGCDGQAWERMAPQE